MKSDPHGLLLFQMVAKKVPLPTCEYKFSERRWRFDCAYVPQRLAIEVHGGVWSGGRHTRGKGFSNDRAKMNRAVELGWAVLEFTTEMVTSGEAVRLVERMVRKGKEIK